MDDQEALKRQYRIARIVAGAIVAFTLVLILVVEVVRSVLAPFKGVASPSEPVEPVRYMLVGLAVCLIPLILVIRQRMLKKDSQDDAQVRLARLMGAAMVTASMGESVAIWGLVLFLLGGWVRDFYILLVLSLILQAIWFPRYEKWEGWFERW